MKKSNILILVLSVLMVAFLSSFIGLSISRDYANNHYEVNHEKVKYTLSVELDYYGCGENDCKYCNGKKVMGSLPYSQEDSSQFVYYKTVNTFRTIFLICLIVSAAGLITTVIVKYREPLRKVFKKN